MEQDNQAMQPQVNAFGPRSTFNGDVGGYVGTAIVAGILSAVTLGIGTPWAICMYCRYVFDNSVIQGRRIRFTGSGGSLLGNWIKWFLLMIVTLGIYSFWVFPNICRWVAEHIEFAD